MHWQILIVFYFVFSVSRELFIRWFVQRSKFAPQVVAAGGYLLGVVPAGLLIGFLGDERVFNWEAETLLLLAAVGTFIALFAAFSYAAKKLVNLTLALTLHQIYVIVAAVLGWLLLGETLSAQQVFGGFLLLTGAYMAIYSVRRNGRKPGALSTSIKGAILALFGGIFLGIGLVAEKASIDSMNASAYFIVGWGIQAIGTTLVAAPKLRQVKPGDFNRLEVAGMAMCGLLSATGGFLFISVLTRVDNIGFAVLLTTFNLPLAVIASHFILHERDNSKLLIAACAMSFAGLLITAV